MSTTHTPAYLSLRPQALTKEAFAPFGDVIETNGTQWIPINDGTTQRYHALTKVDVVGEGSETILSIFRASQRSFPLAIDFLEKHPLGSQAFIPLALQRFLILVAPPGTAPRLDTLRLFYSNGRQGINYHRDVWHYPLLALESDSDFLVADRRGPGQNCDLFHFPSDWQVEIGADWADEIR